ETLLDLDFDPFK
nr:Chain E, Amphiphysin [Homo sapiens]5M61_F Chain F, Amphiphysin [Homo sapiens]5M61_G Chain G, Amphiphysin [Homo sapiens]5M61_H Chain H, Amphiphysin [Homo sapiens]